MEPRIDPASDFGRVEGALSGCIGAVLGSCLIGSAVGGLAYALVVESAFELGDLLAAPFIFVLALALSLPIVGLFTVIFGLPFSWLVARLKAEGAITYGLGGLLLGLFVTLVIPPPDYLGVLLGLSGGVYGCACGLLWWHTYRKWRQ